MHFTLPFFECRRGGYITLVSLGLGPHTQIRTGKSPRKVQDQIVEDLRHLIAKMPAKDLAMFDLARGTALQKVRVELPAAASGTRGKIGGIVPLILEPRWASDSEKMVFVYHPQRQLESFPLSTEMTLEEQARIYFSKQWADLDREEVEGLFSQGKDRIVLHAFSAEVRPVFEDLPEKDGPKKALVGEEASTPKGPRSFRVLREIGEDLVRESTSSQETFVSMSPHREQMGLLLGATKRTPTLVVGPSGVGKSMLIRQWIDDAITADGYPIHKNLDRVRPIFRVSAKRIIAGMSYVGEWEKRALDLLRDARLPGVVLVVDDLHLFGRVGRSRDSDRSLADLFRGPLARREIVVVGECTAESLRMLTEDAPSFASLFTRVYLPEATRGTTFRLLVHEMRVLERKHEVEITAPALRSILDLGASLVPTRALPGKAIDLLRELARKGEAKKNEPIGPDAVVSLLSQKTGVPTRLLRPEEPLDADKLEAEIGQQIIGQPEAVRAATELILKIKSGLTDPKRPYGVYLFTGPTGTGKTELAKCIAEVLYGSTSRLVRFDMSELSGPDAAARLIGDRWEPSGLLTRQILEQPFSVLLLDEIEKAHRSVHNLFLQLFEDGRLTDASGTTADFSHTVVIMTSNLGARARSAVGFGESPDAVLFDIARAVREFFAPELFNRIDRVVPFRPLNPEAASRIAGKELDRLMARRGLADRNIFVSRTPGVVDRVAREAFRAEDGARSIKRYLEDRIGRVLAAAIAESKPSAVRILRLFEAETGYRLERELLEEAPPITGTLALEPFLQKSDKELLEQLARGLRDFGHEHHEGRESLSEQIGHHLAEHRSGVLGHSDELFQLDALRSALDEFEARVEEILHEASPASSYEDIEARRFGTLNIPEEGFEYGHRVKLFDRRMLKGASRHLTHEGLLDCLAEGAFLARASRLVREPGQHAVFLRLERAGRLDDTPRFQKQPAGLLEWLAKLYAESRGMVDAFAARVSGKIVESGGAVTLDATLARNPAAVVLKIIGLAVRDYFELEAGSHLLRSMSRGSEIVRVSVLPASSDARAADLLREPATDVALFASAEARPVAKAPLLPLVRIVRFDPPERAGQTAPVEIEDFPIGYADTVEAKNLAEALRPLFRLRMTRTLPPSSAS